MFEMMTTEEMIDEFTQALNILQEYNQMSFDFWCTELFVGEQEWNWNNFTESNLKLIQDDVMHSTEYVLLG